MTSKNLSEKIKQEKFEESETKKNLTAALQGETLAHLKYQFYKSKISNLSKEFEAELDEIIHNEKEHGKIWFKKLHNGEIPDNIENLKDAIAGEKHECSQMYPSFAEMAEKEGYYEIATLFRKVGEIECSHWERFEEILKEIESDSVFKNDEENIEWKCLNCGYIHRGKRAPDSCPVCNHPKKYFKKNR